MQKELADKTIFKYLARVPKTKSYFKENISLYILALPGFLFLLLFCYFPMGGLAIIFKNYNFKDGIFGSPWVGFKNFEFFFSSFDKALRATQNTIFLNASYIIFGTIFSVALAIMFNEIKRKGFLKITQSLSIFPYFLSWVVIGGISITIIDYDKGSFNQLLVWLGFSKIDFYTQPAYWPFILTISNIFKTAGYNSIIYYAVLQNLDPAFYESAVVDGATRMQQIFNISIPLLKPTVILLSLLAVGRIFYGDLTMMMGMTGLNPVLLPTTDILDTFVYRSVVKEADFAMASAVGLYQSIFGFLLVIISNYSAGRFDKEYKIF